MDSQLSIILPVKNGENFLKDAFASIMKNHATLLAEAVNCGLELFVIDDGSSDQTPDLCRAFGRVSPFPVHLFQGQGKGPSSARNLALSAVKTPYLTFLDHDDLWPENRLLSHFLQLESHPDWMGVVGKTEFFSADPDKLKPFQLKEKGALHHVNLGAATFRKTLFDHLGGFDETLLFSEDHDFFFRIREGNYPIAYLDEIGLHYRLHETNMTRHKTLQEVSTFEVLRASLKRRSRITIPAFGEGAQ